MNWSRASIIVSTALFTLLPATVRAEENKVEKVVPEVYFHEGEIKGKGHCNNGWIVFEDYILVIDANFPSGADVVIPKIKASANKPIRFAFNTHHHGDHAYGNQTWVDLGAVPVATTGVAEEMKKVEPGRWNEMTKTRKDVAASKFKAPTLLFPKELFFDDGTHRVELHFFGVAHTVGDGFAWLPKEKVLYTGDACVNGAYNYMGDGDSNEWIKTLEAARALGPKFVCPGHGPMGGPEVLDDQIAFFKALRNEVSSAMKDSAARFDAKAAAAKIKPVLEANKQIARYVGGMLESQVAKVYKDMGGKTDVSMILRDARQAHENHTHGLEVLEPHTHPASRSPGL